MQVNDVQLYMQMSTRNFPDVMIGSILFCFRCIDYFDEWCFSNNRPVYNNIIMLCNGECIPTVDS